MKVICDHASKECLGCEHQDEHIHIFQGLRNKKKAIYCNDEPAHCNVFDFDNVICIEVKDDAV